MSSAPLWDRAALCAALSLALPHRFGGLVLKARAGPVRKLWLESLRDLVPADKAPIVVPASVSPDRLTASLSLARSISEGRAVHQPGLLDDAAGGCMIMNMAERLDTDVAALVAAAIEAAALNPEAAFCTILLDESDALEEGVPAFLGERLAFHIDLDTASIRDAMPFAYDEDSIKAVQEGINNVDATDELMKAIVQTCASVGVISMRIPIFCLEASKALAALDGKTEIAFEHVSLACQLVLSGRDLIAPADPQEAPQEQQSEPENDTPEPESDQSSEPEEATDEDVAAAMEALQSAIIEAVTGASVSMKAKDVKRLDRRVGGVSGRSGDLGHAYDRGRPDRLVRYRTGRGRVDVLGTLRAAAPMQSVRGRKAHGDSLKLRMDDLRAKRFKRRKQCSVIFVVDASGSSAMYRMAEAKGAVESLLSQCYARRDMVSLVAFGGFKSDVVLQPTRSLVRAQRELTQLSGGGATPLAHAVATASTLAYSEQARGRTPFLVFMSDGRGNISLEGEPDRARSAEQVQSLARRYIRGSVQAIYFDISRRPDARSKALSDDLGAQYEFLPVAGANAVSSIVRERIGAT